jgi:1,6-anhydro-N-acetylmuramate kinase
MSGTSVDGIDVACVGLELDQLGAAPLRLPEPAGTPPRHLRLR